MKAMNKIYLAVLIVTAALFPSTALSDPEAANFSTSSSTLSIPFVKVDGILLFKNLELFLNVATGGFEIRALEEVLPNDIINIDTTISLAVGSFTDFIFRGFFNVPILVAPERQTGNVAHGISILDSSGFLRAQTVNFTSGLRETAFTPMFDDIFTIRIQASSGAGDLNVKGSVLTSGPISARNKAQVIARGSSVSGTLAENAFDDYLFAGTANVPITIRTQRTSDSLSYHICILDSAGILLGTTVNFTSGIRDTPFTPPSNGTFRIRIEGADNFGDYILTIQ